MTEVILHGLIGKRFGQQHKFVNIPRVADFVSALESRRTGIKKYILEQGQLGINYELVVNDEVVKDEKEVLGKRLIKKIELVPAVGGSLDQFFISLVINLMMVGIQSILSPNVEIPIGELSDSVETRSFAFSSRQNIAAQGVALPLGYGRLKIGSRVINTKVNSVPNNVIFTPDTEDTPNESVYNTEYSFGRGVSWDDIG